MQNKRRTKAYSIADRPASLKQRRISSKKRVTNAYDPASMMVSSAQGLMLARSKKRK